MTGYHVAALALMLGLCLIGLFNIWCWLWAVCTGWKPLTEPPIRPGVYELRNVAVADFKGPIYSRWDGTSWLLTSSHSDGGPITTMRSHTAYCGIYSHWR